MFVKLLSVKALVYIVKTNPTTSTRDVSSSDLGGVWARVHIAMHLTRPSVAVPCLPAVYLLCCWSSSSMVSVGLLSAVAGVSWFV